jgi:nucleoside-diphosphate-sugar epimerase
MKVLVTGASGFVGRAVCARLSEVGDVELTATARSSDHAGVTGGGIVARELGSDTSWRDLLDSVDVIVHAAARVHVMRGPDDHAAYRRVNVDGTLNLARQAADCGVQRFVFLSSVKVNGDNTQPGQAFGADDQPAPVDAYGLSKHEAEMGLLRLVKGHDMEVVTIRPPLVYGPGVKANFLALMRWVYKRYPLPFATVDNARSLLALDNLVDLIGICCRHPGAANETFMAADGEDISTAELVSRIGIALNRPARLVAVPPKVLLTLATIAGKRSETNKLLGNLQVDTRKTRELLDWKPATTMDQALVATAKHFLEGRA